MLLNEIDCNLALSNVYYPLGQLSKIGSYQVQCISAAIMINCHQMINKLENKNGRQTVLFRANWAELVLSSFSVLNNTREFRDAVKCVLSSHLNELKCSRLAKCKSALL